MFKGQASVQNGEFSYTFVVPKDISYNYGQGKLSYYAENQIEDANGFYTDFYIGGTADNFEADEVGPEIELFMNDENFVFGGITDDSPILLANISDVHGINMVGNGIGHDIVAIHINHAAVLVVKIAHVVDLKVRLVIVREVEVLGVLVKVRVVACFLITSWSFGRNFVGAIFLQRLIPGGGLHQEPPPFLVSVELFSEWGKSGTAASGPIGMPTNLVGVRVGPMPEDSVPAW